MIGRCSKPKARSTNVDLIVKGTVDGSMRGLLYQPASNNYASDRTGSVAFHPRAVDREDPVRRHA
jgi:hypothetical protein